VVPLSLVAILSNLTIKEVTNKAVINKEDIKVASNKVAINKVDSNSKEDSNNNKDSNNMTHLTKRLTNKDLQLNKPKLSPQPLPLPQPPPRPPLHSFRLLFIMLPAKRNKIDISKLTEEEQKLFRLYGKLPTHKNHLTKMQKDRKYFDSGDYALSKAGVAPQTAVGTAIPNPENIPHASSPANGSQQNLSVSPTNSSSPAKESTLSQSQQAVSSEPLNAGLEAPGPVAAED
jgi:hypothetical protein